MDRLCNPLSGGIDSYYIVTLKFEHNKLPKSSKIGPGAYEFIRSVAMLCCTRSGMGSGPVHQIHLSDLSVPTMKSCTRPPSFLLPSPSLLGRLLLLVSKNAVSHSADFDTSDGQLNWMAFESKSSFEMLGRFVR